jgi:zinc transport system permease protein
MFEMFAYEFMQRALLAGLLIGTICAVLGVFLVLKRLSLLGDGLAHAAFAGVSLGLLFNVYPLLSALVATTVGALGVQKLISKTKIYGDAATAVVLSLGMGIAVLIISSVKGFNVDLFSYLFGSILAISTDDLWIIAGVFVAVLAFVISQYRKLMFVAFNEDVARTSGINVNLIESVFVMITAMTVVVAIRAVGILLVSALLVIPAITAFQIAGSFKRALMVAVVAALSAILGGIVVSYQLDLAPSGTIVVLLCTFFMLAELWKSSKIKKEHMSS